MSYDTELENLKNVVVPTERWELPLDKFGKIDREELARLVPNLRPYEMQEVIIQPSRFNLFTDKIIICELDLPPIYSLSSAFLGKFVVGEDGEYRIWWNKHTASSPQNFEPLGKVTTTNNYIGVYAYSSNDEVALTKEMANYALNGSPLKYILLPPPDWLDDYTLLRLTLSSSRMSCPKCKVTDDTPQLEDIDLEEI